MHSGVDITGTTSYVETTGMLSVSGTNYMASFLGLFTGGVLSARAIATTPDFYIAIAKSSLLYDASGGGNIKIGCMHANAQLSAQAATSAYFFIYNDRVSPPLHNYYQWLAGMTTSSLICREAYVTNGARMFFYYDSYTNGGGAKV